MAEYSLIQFWYWFLHGNVANFASVYLLDRGISNSVIGIMMAFACCGAILVQALSSGWADRVGIRALKILLIGADMTLAACSLICILFGGSPSVIPAGFYVMMLVVTQMLLPFVNAVGTESINRGMKINFGIARGIGSVGFAAMSVAVGQIAGRFGAKALPFSILAAAFIHFLCVSRFWTKLRRAGAISEGKVSVRGDDGISAEDTGGRKAFGKGKSSAGGRAFLRKYHYFGFLMAAYVLVFCCHVYMNSFLFQIVLDKGGDSAGLGIAMAIAAASELPVMFFFDRMLRHRNAAFWMKLSAFFFALKGLGQLLAPNMTVLYIAQLLQMPGWGLVSVASVRYIDQVMQQEDKVKGQAYINMPLTFAKIIGTMTGGLLIDGIGAKGMLLTAVIVSAAGAIMQAVIVTRHPGLTK